MDVSLNVSGVESCGHYAMSMVQGNATPVGITTDCTQTAEECQSVYTFCQYRCDSAENLLFGWRGGSSRLQNGMNVCDLRWSYETC